MRRRRNQLTIAAVAFVLGCSSSSSSGRRPGNTGLAQLSAQDLTVLVANLNERNDQLRTRGRVARARARDAHLEPVPRRRLGRRDPADLAGSAPTPASTRSTGPGVTISVSGPIDGAGVEDLINELRTAGAEAIAAGGVRLVPGVVVVGDAGRGDRGRGRRWATRSRSRRSARRSS